MPTLQEVPDDPKYTIKAVSVQTGIRPVTLRAWERRHDILSPHRSDNRYRLYSDRDVAVLRWIKSRVDSGISISSAASELKNMVGKGDWPEAVPVAAPVLVGLRNMPASQYAREFYQSLIHHDEARANELLTEASAAFDLLTVCMQIFIPTLVAIGEAWYHGEIRVTTEHYASNYVRGKLLSTLQGFPIRRNAAYLLVGCAPLEQHELGALMLATLLRSRNYRVEYLGIDVPVDDLVEYARYERPDMVILAASSSESALELATLQEKLNKMRSAPLFGFGGRAFDRDPRLCDKIPGIYLGNTLEKAISTVRDVLAGKPPPNRVSLN
jgi:DNA-binding transcriptional MerR regulator